MEYFHSAKIYFHSIMSRGIVRPGRIGPKFAPKDAVLQSRLFSSFIHCAKMDLNRSIIRSEVRQALEEYLQSNTNRSANAGETGRLEGSCKIYFVPAGSCFLYK